MKPAPIKGTLLLVVIAAASAGCYENVALEPKPYNPRPSIEGLLQPGQPPRIFVNHTVPFFTPDQTPSSLFVRDADIVLTGPDGAEILTADSTYDRFWCRWGPYYAGSAIVRADATYRLDVTIDGRTYTAEAVTDVPAVQIDSVSYVAVFTDIYGGHEGVVVDFRDLAGMENQYRFLMTRPLDNEHETVDDREYSSTCLADGEVVEVDEIGRFVYYDNKLDGIPVTFVVEPAYTHRRGDESWVHIQSLSRDAADFYYSLDLQREANINPFIEPVFLESNIDGAIGVFGAVNRSDAVHFVFPEDAQ